MESKVYKYGDLELYAKDGIIHAVHKQPGDNEPYEKIIAIKEMQARLDALDQVANNFYLKSSLVPKERDFYNSAVKFREICRDVIRDAKYQGDPTDDKILNDKIHESRKNYTIKPNKENESE